MATATKPQAQVTASSPDAPGPAGLDAMIAQATAAYRELVCRHAQGELDGERIDLEILSLAGRSLVQFRADSERLRKRLAAVVQLDSAEELEKEIEPAQRRVAEAEKELQRLNEEYYPKAAELQQKVAAAQSDFFRKESRMSDSRRKARDVLHETAAPEILGQLHRLRGAFSEAKRDSLLSKHNAPEHQRRAANQEQACNSSSRDLNAQLRDPFQGMAWEK
jgi:hypothetical protein